MINPAAFDLSAAFSPSGSEQAQRRKKRTIRNGRKFIVMLTPHIHSFRSDDQKEPLCQKYTNTRKNKTFKQLLLEIPVTTASCCPILKETRFPKFLQMHLGILLQALLLWAGIL